MITVIIDSREKGLLEHFINNENTNSQNNNIVYKSANLDVGDIQIISDLDPNKQIVFERKTIADLCQSIKDGRFKDQKARLLSAFEPRAIFYIIEGQWLYYHDKDTSVDKVHGIQRECINGLLVKTIVRDQISIFQTQSLNDTIHFLEFTIKRLLKNPSLFPEAIVEPKEKEKEKEKAKVDDVLVSQIRVKTKKKDNLSKQNVLILQLSCIPGISIKTAQLICDHLQVDSMQEFVEKVQNVNLTQIPRIGKGLNQTIRDHILKNIN